MGFSQIAIIGVGLLGGSIGAALRAAGSSAQITGYGHRIDTLHKAAEYGVIDRWSMDLAHAVKDADLVILCTPVSLFEQLLEGIAPAVAPGAIVTDVGSTKRSVVEAAHRLLPGHCGFVGSHPMAGSEKRGVEYARADLFNGATCIVTPTADSNPEHVQAIEEFWTMLRMKVVRLSPEEHDAAISDISHLPHVLAAALVAMQADSSLPLAGKGFLDTTRIASGDAAMWRDILLDNRDNVLASLEKMKKQITLLKKLLNRSNSEALKQWLTAASDRRDRLMQQKLRELSGD